MYICLVNINSTRIYLEWKFMTIEEIYSERHLGELLLKLIFESQEGWKFYLTSLLKYLMWHTHTHTHTRVFDDNMCKYPCISFRLKSNHVWLKLNSISIFVVFEFDKSIATRIAKIEKFIGIFAENLHETKLIHH